MLNFVQILQIFILLYMNLCSSGFVSVNFREFYDVHVEPFNTQIYKRELSQFFDKASYAFNGFEKIESIPVLFPIDICIMNVDGIKYATALHVNRNRLRQFAVFRMRNGTYDQLADIPTPNAVALDCKDFGAKGYIAVALNITTTTEDAIKGSPIFEIAGDHIRAVQYFSTMNLFSIYLRNNGNDLFLLQTFRNTMKEINLKCPFFKWSGTTFIKLGEIPCSNSRHLEPFSIDYESYVAVANFADKNGQTNTNSEIYKYNREQKRFLLFQRIRTSGAVDVKYFNVPYDEVKRQHFLIFGNSLKSRSRNRAGEQLDGDDKNREADSIFYIFDKGQFVPYQSLSLYAVEQFLPVQNIDAEKFLLLVACKDQDIKIYNLNDWKFEESEAQFTAGALSKGVAKMRVYQENENCYLVIANELMMENETNIFLPIFKRDEHANALRQEIIDWAKTQIERLTKIDIEKLKQDVEQKISKHTHNSNNFGNITNANIQTVVTKSLIYPQLHFNTNLWKALSYANLALDALEKRLLLKQRQRPRLKRDTSNEGTTEHNYERLHVHTLIVDNQIKVKKINGIEMAKPLFKKISAEKIIVSGVYKQPIRQHSTTTTSTLSGDEYVEEIIDEVTVEELQISGKLNKHTWNDLYNNTLKITADKQFIKAPVNINNMFASTVIVTNNEVNGQNLGKLIPINGGSYVVNQDVHFTAPIIAKNVVINQRLNNLHIYKNKFHDVLLRNSNETQIVEGTKNFENIKVLQPITIAGRMLGQQLRSFSPSIPIHKNIILQGNYTINGDVIISKLLKADDIIDGNTKSSLKMILQNALRIDKNNSLEDVNIRFEQPIQVNNSIVSFINTHDLQQLLRMNTDEIQVVEGVKIFKTTLEIHNGFVEVKQLNGIDIEKLEKRLFLKNTNETIKVPMHFGKIIAKGVKGPNITLGDNNLSAYLTKSTNQDIQGALKVDILLVQQLLNVENLNTNGNIFNQQLDKIYQQKAKSAPSADIFQMKRKFHGTIYVKNLKMNTTINGASVNEIVQLLSLLDGKIKFEGNFLFHYDMNITNLTFHGKLNGIPAQEFGHCWLQRTGAQQFTATQTIATAQSRRGIQLNGTLNEYQMDDFIYNTYWINRNEHLHNVIYENPIQIQGALFTKILNNLHVPHDILYHSAVQPQVIYAQKFIVQDNVFVKDTIFNATTINGIDFVLFEQYLNGIEPYSNALHVENAYFTIPPIYATLNQHDLERTLNEIWLINENVDLHNHVEISEAYFDGLLEFNGPINNMNLQYIKDNYFSLSRPQEIAAELFLNSDTIFQNDFTANNMHLFGPIITDESGAQINFDEFVSHTLKTAGPHTITGNWRMRKAKVQGDLCDVNINSLNLVRDVVRFDVPLNVIMAPKHVYNATIPKLFATDTSTVNNIPVTKWIHDTVYVYENHTITGVTTLEAVNVYNDLQVLGTVNNLTFNEQTILLRDLPQHIRGEVYIQNRFSERILTSNFENLYTDAVNDVNLESFLANHAKYEMDTEINCHLIFSQPVYVEQYQNGDIVYDMKWKRAAYNNSTKDAIEDWNRLEHIMINLKKNVEEIYHNLDHFEIRQVLSINATKLIPLTLRGNSEYIDIIGVVDQNKNHNLNFYRWNSKTKNFSSDDDSFIAHLNVKFR